MGTIERVTIREADITGAESVGALVGVSRWGNIMRSSVREATVAGDVEGSRIGGLVGGNDGTIAKSSVHGTTINGGSQVGGLVGYHQLSTVSKLCVQATDIAGKRKIGGLVGRQSTTAGGEGGTVVESAVHEANVIGEGLVGGLVGSNGPFTEIVESWAASKIQADEIIGGLVGDQDERGTVTAGYWDTELTDQIQGVGAGSGDVTGLTTTELHGETAAKHMDALDFETTWATQSDPDGYPVLQWMTDTGHGTDAA
jgi:hypothetical protein